MKRIENDDHSLKTETASTQPQNSWKVEIFNNWFQTSIDRVSCGVYSVNNNNRHQKSKFKSLILVLK